MWCHNIHDRSMIHLHVTWRIHIWRDSFICETTHTCHQDIAGRVLAYAQHAATHCNALKHTATHCNTLQGTAIHCSTLQGTTTHCNTLQHTVTHCNTLQLTATRFSALKHTATHCNTLQGTAAHCKALQCTATHCNTLLQIATHCTKLQHAATPSPWNLLDASIRDSTHSYATWRIYMWHDSFIRDMPRSHDASICDWRIHMRGGGLGSSTIFKKFNETYAPS